MFTQFNALMNQAVQLFQKGNFEESNKLLTYILNIQAKNVDALHLKGVILGIQQKPKDAQQYFEKALKIKPNSSIINFNLAKSFSDSDNDIKAIPFHVATTRLNPKNYNAWLNYGISLDKLQRYDEALIAYETAINLDQNLALAWSNRGATLKDLKKSEEALNSCDKAIALEPELAVAWMNRGNAQKDLHQYQQALVSYDKAIDLKPDFAEAFYNRAVTLTDVGRCALALDNYREVIRLNPDHLEARSNLLFTINYVESFSQENAVVEAKRYGTLISSRSNPKYKSWKCNSKTPKLKIGFVSGDMRNHPVGYFIEGLIEHLDTTKFEIHAFPTTTSSDDLTRRLKPFFEEWTPIHGKSDIDAASAIHQKGIHILFDLSGHTAHSRLSVFSFKPAPIQVTWLGYFATTGIPEIDYFLSDPHMSPPNEPNHFTEKIWKMAEIWLCMKTPSPTIPISQIPALSNGFLTFGCFANLSKINEKVVSTWASILRQIPESRLLLKNSQFSDPTLIQYIQRQFVQYGISVNRLNFEGPESRSVYFEAYNRVDFVLDTFPYPGGTTSIDALWMGVPVLTLKGDRFLSHLGESIAINAGQSDWIAEDIDDYINKAIYFSSNLEIIKHLRNSLRERVLNSPIFDTPRFAKNFGEVLQGMWGHRSNFNGSSTESSVAL
jgi:predicted O-linked N-acetylglucosamine transferase (SPINDLY family)